ncbi:MAG: RNA-binding protein [bacterium]
MGKKLYVGNLSYGVTSETLAQLFSAHGKVDSADVIIDRMTGRGKGFGFVEMSTDAEAAAAIAATNGQDLEGRAMIVNEARPPAPRVGGSGGGFGGGDRDRKGGFGGGRGGGGFGGGRGGAGGRR